MANSSSQVRQSERILDAALPIDEARKIPGLQPLTMPYGIHRKAQLAMFIKAKKHLEEAGTNYVVVRGVGKMSGAVELWRTGMLQSEEAIKSRKYSPHRYSSHQ